MNLPYISIKRVLLFTTFVSMSSFFLLLYVSNTVNRQGISEMNTLQKDITLYTTKTRELDLIIATASSLDRVEKRGVELGFGPAQKIEYLR